MKVALTGATGFIGMHLVRALISTGHEVVYSVDSVQPIYGGDIGAIRRDQIAQLPVNFEESQIENISPQSLAMKMQSAEIVIHLAANAGVRNSAQSPFEYSVSNMKAFTNVLEAVRILRPKLFITASSSSVYGKSPISGPQKEDFANGTNLASYYAATKWANEILAKSYSDSFNLNIVALRFFTVYGSFGRPDMAYWNFAERIRSGQEIQLYGDDGGARSFSHVSDIVDSMVSLMSSEKLYSGLESSSSQYMALNLGSEVSTRTIDMITILGNLLNKAPSVKRVERPKFDVDQTWADMTKTYSLIPKKTYKQLDEGLEEFTNWFNSTQ
jgi:UDP-glucuronate 4-epimerase